MAIRSSRREFLMTAGAGAAGLLLPGLLGNRAWAEGTKPNIVFVMADDLGYECLGCYGGTSYQTPHLDALAQSGMRFEYCYATPLCSPSRAEVMTGRYGFRTGWTQLIEKDGDFFDPLKEKTFAHVLKDAGYATAIAGKWQLCQFDQHPNHLKECGFDESCMWTWTMKGKASSRYWDPTVWQNGKLLDGTKGKYGPDIYSDFLCDFISRHRDKPFFAYYPMALVHDPLDPTPDSRGAGKGKKGGGKNDGDKFAAMVAYMDKIVGKLAAHLEKLGLREKTLLCFTGDNGVERYLTSKVGDREVQGGKKTMADTGSHVPLIAHWPGTVPAGKVTSDLVDFSDFLPTFAELGGAALPKGVAIDGHSFAAQLRGEKGRPREWAYVQLGKSRFVRDQRWKLNEKGELYDTKADPDEKAPLKTGQGGAEAAAARDRLKKAMEALK